MGERRRRDFETQGGAGKMLLLGGCREITEQSGVDFAFLFVFGRTN
jgi:hypothetical protein